MGKTSDIQWTDATWNPWQGCRKVSQGCKFCYAERLASRFGKNFSQVFRSTVKTFNSPLKWDDPKKVFTCSISDFFIEEADLWRKEAWDIIRSTPQHTYQILTKRPERINVCLPSDWGHGWDNVWLGVSGESSNMIVKRSRIFETVKAKTKSDISINWYIDVFHTFTINLFSKDKQYSWRALLQIFYFKMYYGMLENTYCLEQFH